MSGGERAKASRRPFHWHVRRPPAWHHEVLSTHTADRWLLVQGHGDGAAARTVCLVVTPTGVPNWKAVVILTAGRNESAPTQRRPKPPADDGSSDGSLARATAGRRDSLRISQPSQPSAVGCHRYVRRTLPVSGSERANASRRPLQWCVRQPYATPGCSFSEPTFGHSLRCLAHSEEALPSTAKTRQAAETPWEAAALWQSSKAPALAALGDSAPQ